VVGGGGVVVESQSGGADALAHPARRRKCLEVGVLERDPDVADNTAGAPDGGDRVGDA
jgi:hypothetical protein